MFTRALVSTLALCTAVLPPAAAVMVPSSVAAEATSARTVTPLHDNWRFHFGKEDAGFISAGYNDSSWENISLPHTWNRVGEYGLQRSSRSNNQQGLGWYRLSYKAPAASKGQRQYIDFAAVGNIADVWVNDVHIGQHKGAFSRFRFDVTAQWKPGAENLIVVRADNSKAEPGSSTAEVLPLSGDFFIYGGLYRGVSLITTSSAGIDLLDFGGPGVYARAENITAEKADVSVLTRLRNSETKPRKLTALVTISDALGNPVSKSTTPVTLKSGATELTSKLSVANPRLWNGRVDPYLYQVKVDLFDRNTLIDSVTQPLGIRSFRIDANEGFFLNGKHISLHGASRHQDRQDKGWALSRKDHAEDMALMIDMGVNTVRHAHYQHADEWSDEADKAGMVVWAEVPFVTASSYDSTEGTPATFANAEQQTRELIRQNYNHPSIFMWSVGNEVDASALFLSIGKPAKALRLLQHVNKIAKEEDPFRPTTFADCCEDTAFGMPNAEKLAGTADLIGFNRYYGYYYGSPQDMQNAMATGLDKLHAKHPNLPMSVTEYGAGGALSQHSDNPEGGLINPVGRPHPEEFLSLYHEEAWKALKPRKYLYATWMWNMFDFASDLRQEGDATDLNDKGLITYDRKIKKDAFYFYKANWSQEPVLHLTSKRHSTRPYPVIDVKAYANADTVRLSVNGEDRGEVKCPDRICIWKNVPLKSGSNEAVVTATIQGQALVDRANWNAPDITAGYRIDTGNLVGRTLNGQTFGSDAFFSGGVPMELNNPMLSARGGAQRKAKGISPELFENWRQGEKFSYEMPLPDGKWNVTFYTFAPSLLKGDETQLSVLANGSQVVKPFNVVSEAGGKVTGFKKTVSVDVKGGHLKLDFSATGGPAVIAALEISK